MASAHFAAAHDYAALQGLLNKKPERRLDWPHLLDHPFVKESEEERLMREQRICSAAACAEASRAWKGEGGAIAGAAVYSGAVLQSQHLTSQTLDVFQPAAAVLLGGKAHCVGHQAVAGLSELSPLAGSRGGTPLRDPGVRASLLSPEVGVTPGVLQSKQLNTTPLPYRKALPPTQGQGAARDRIPAHQTHMATPALKAPGGSSGEAAGGGDAAGGNLGFVQPHECGASCLHACVAVADAPRAIFRCLHSARKARSCLQQPPALHGPARLCSNTRTAGRQLLCRPSAVAPEGEQAEAAIAAAERRVQDHASASQVLSDAKTMAALMQQLRVPSSLHAAPRWASSEELRCAATLAGAFSAKQRPIDTKL
jgi:hypothetical protein